MQSNVLILVAGSEPADREAVLQTLGDAFHVVAAQTIENALSYSDDSVGLVICDFESSQLRGLELMRQWKARHSHTPFLALINGHDVGSAVEAMKNGVSDCLAKPIDQDELRATAIQLVDTNSFVAGSGHGDDESAKSRKLHIDIPPGTSLEDLERAAVEQALVQHHGNRTHAAKTLGISVRTLQRKLKAWGMPIMSFPHSSPAGSFMISPHMASNHLFSSHVH